MPVSFHAFRHSKPDLISEVEILLRRWSTILVIGFGLLLGGFSPAFACAAAAKHGDCCPEGSTSPCRDEKEAPGFGSLTACCVTAPPVSSAVVAEVIRNTPDLQHDSGSPDLIIALAWFATLSPHVRAPQTLVPAMFSPRTDAALIYLRTGRLRL